VCTHEEMQPYLGHCRRKAHVRIQTMSDEEAGARCGFECRDMSFAELIVTCLRHVQHHTGQLNLLLRQHTDSAPRWVFRADDAKGPPS